MTQRTGKATIQLMVTDVVSGKQWTMALGHEEFPIFASVAEEPLPAFLALGQLPIDQTTSVKHMRKLRRVILANAAANIAEKLADQIESEAASGSATAVSRWIEGFN
ncbi:hypothetical protein GCM10007913_12110 [Devosia yakushimensis]|uniref:Uncharacterized protein n=1 Tax=Devosia yakushimensis TaxID=470028 RepID=A0ABQ5UDP5_9HYPH|nr:hypothetical protein [Devosia yakushimensis]GLQ09279.1 hypothetical protein GCM10007913_12110 [Devosia yakushimensis]